MKCSMDSSAFSFLGEKFEIQTELDLAKSIVRDRAEVKTKSDNKNKVLDSKFGCFLIIREWKCMLPCGNIDECIDRSIAKGCPGKYHSLTSSENDLEWISVLLLAFLSIRKI